MLVADRAGHKKWMIAYQSRSGSPNEEWLEPDVCDVIGALAARGFYGHHYSADRGLCAII